MTPPIDDGTAVLLVIILGALAIGLLEALVRKLADLVGYLRYLNMEIKRSEGWERRRWKQKKQKLLLSLIPFYSLFKKKKE